MRTLLASHPASPLFGAFGLLEASSPTAPAPLGDVLPLRRVVVAVVASVLGVSPNHPDVEDGAHEALRRALEGRQRLREGEPVRPWVIGIARHVALDMRRAAVRSRRRDGGDAQGDGASEVVDSAPDPAERVETAERAQRLRKALQRLPEGPRNALVLLHGEGLGYQAIAERLGVPLGTVATWIARGRKVLAENVAEQGEALV